MSDRPTGWIKTSFGAVFTETHERRRDRDALPVLSVTKTRGPMLASERFGKVLHSRDLTKYRVARYGSIVADPMLLWDGAIGRQEVVDEGIVSPDYRVYELSHSVSSDFMHYVVRNPSMFRYYQGGARGTNVRRNRISRSDFLRIPLNLPPLLEQRKIAAILSSVDQVIKKTEGVVEQLQVVKTAVMKELLTGGLPGRHARFNKTEIGKIPTTWQYISLGQVLDGIDSGWSPQCESVPAGADEWGVLKISSVTWGEFKDSENKRLPPHLQPRSEIEVHAGDVIVSRANTPELVGRAVLVRRTRPKLMLSDKLLRLRVVKNAVDARFLNLVLALPHSREFIKAGATGTSRSMKNISQSKLRELPLALPTLEEQAAISDAIEALSLSEQREKDNLAALRAVKSALMSVLLSGELRVRSDEGAA